MVILGGKTYLTGALGSLDKEGDSVTVAWSKVSGPGTVTFAAASAPITTATFSSVGDYVLKLTASPNYARDNRPLSPPEDRSTIRSSVWLKDQ